LGPDGDVGGTAGGSPTGGPGFSTIASNTGELGIGEFDILSSMQRPDRAFTSPATPDFTPQPSNKRGFFAFEQPIRSVTASQPA
jgi:hypothetical protein